MEIQDCVNELVFESLILKMRHMVEPVLVVAAFQISAGGNPVPSLKTRTFFIADIYQNGIEKICYTPVI